MYDVVEVKRKCREAIRKMVAAGRPVRPGGFFTSHCLCLIGAVAADADREADVAFFARAVAASILELTPGETLALESGFEGWNPKKLWQEAVLYHDDDPVEGGWPFALDPALVALGGELAASLSVIPSDSGHRS